jgi:hypothetical protein
MDRTFGPIELIVIGFEGNNFTGEIATALGDLVARNIVRIIDLAVVVKDGDGTAHILEMQELSVEVATAMAILTGEVRGLLSEADLNDIADDLAPGTTEAVFLVEHVWATDFAQAVRKAGGMLLDSQRIPGDVVDAARATLIDAAVASL